MKLTKLNCEGSAALITIRSTYTREIMQLNNSILEEVSGCKFFEWITKQLPSQDEHYAYCIMHIRD